MWKFCLLDAEILANNRGNRADKWCSNEERRKSCLSRSGRSIFVRSGTVRRRDINGISISFLQYTSIRAASSLPPSDPNFPWSCWRPNSPHSSSYQGFFCCVLKQATSTIPGIGSSDWELSELREEEWECLWVRRAVAESSCGCEAVTKIWQESVALRHSVDWEEMAWSDQAEEGFGQRFWRCEIQVSHYTSSILKKKQE